MVLIILNTIEFEAEKFETRTMPTPDMKSKEVIYWIRVNTTDKRLATDLQRFLDSTSQYIELHVPSAFIAVKTELESYWPGGNVPRGERRERNIVAPIYTEPKRIEADSDKSLDNSQLGQSSEERYLVEIVLRRALPESKNQQTQAPYG
jgi:hypothetical protein